VSVFKSFIGKKKPKINGYEKILTLLQKFMIESKSQSTQRNYTPPQQAVMTMYTYGSLIYFSELNEVAEQEYIVVLSEYIQRQGLSAKQSDMEARIIYEQAKDPAMHWGVETGYNSAMSWYKNKDANAPKALARLLKTTR